MHHRSRDLWPALMSITPDTAAAIAARGPRRSRLRHAVIDQHDFQPISVLHDAVAQAQSVGRIIVRAANSEVKWPGTGSLVGPDLLLTNAHVLPDRESVTGASVDFNFDEAEPDGTAGASVDTYSLDPEVLVISPYRSEEEGGVDADHLDFALVGVSRKDGQSASDRWGRTRVTPDEKWFGVGHDVFIVQHPNGGPKMISLARNEIVQIRSCTFSYLTDTLPGSSGSPALDQAWRMIGVHHAAAIFSPADGGSYVVNEAIRIDAILDAVPVDVRNLLLSSM